MVRYVLCFLLVAQSADAAVVTLTQKMVAEKALKDSYLALEVNLNAQTARYNRSLLLKPYDFNFVAESGFRSNKFETALVNTGADKTDTYLTTVSLSKMFATTGTKTSLVFTRDSYSFNFPPSATTTSDNYTRDTVVLTLEQNLLRNFLGNATRATSRAAEAAYDAAMISRGSDLQNVVLDSITLFWNAYVAQETFQEALSSRERYLKLVQDVRKKSNYGYSNPGELPQVQAELEVKEQAVKRESVNYLSNVDNLATLLKYPAGTEFKFQVNQDIPPVPKLEAVDYEKTRLVRAARLRAQAADDLYKAANSNSYPDVSLVGSIGSAGLERTASESYSELNSGTHPQYYLGVKLAYNFGSDSLNEEKLNKKILKELEDTRLQRNLAEVNDRSSNLQRRLQSTYAIVLSAKAQRDFREKAALDLNRTYTQGRTDISVLIEALNKFYTAKIDYIKAIGDYQIALNQWAALRDQLIPEDSTNGK